MWSATTKAEICYQYSGQGVQPLAVLCALLSNSGKPFSWTLSCFQSVFIGNGSPWPWIFFASHSVTLEESILYDFTCWVWTGLVSAMNNARNLLSSYKYAILFLCLSSLLDRGVWCCVFEQNFRSGCLNVYTMLKTLRGGGCNKQFLFTSALDVRLIICALLCHILKMKHQDASENATLRPCYGSDYHYYNPIDLDRLLQSKLYSVIQLWNHIISTGYLHIGFSLLFALNDCNGKLQNVLYIAQLGSAPHEWSPC